MNGDDAEDTDDELCLCEPHVDADEDEDVDSELIEMRQH